jgi:hypothetical protein
MSNEIKMCLNCGCISEIDDSGNIIQIKEAWACDTTCPNCHKNNIISVDEEIAWYIFKLNKSGFKTRFCCSGHAIENYSGFYICFESTHNELKEYFKNTKDIKVLTLSTNVYGYLYGDRSLMVSIPVSDVKYYGDHFTTLNKYSYRIGVKNEDKIYDNCCKIKNVIIDNSIGIILKHDIYSDLKNLITRLCIK